MTGMVFSKCELYLLRVALRRYGKHLSRHGESASDQADVIELRDKITQLIRKDKYGNANRATATGANVLGKPQSE